MTDIGLLLRLIERESVLGDWESVLRLLDRTEPLADPGKPDAEEFLLYHRGYALLELDRPDEAIQSLQRLVELDGATAHYRLLLADSLIRSEAWDEALVQLQAGLDAEPDHPGCMCAMGWAFYQRGDREAGRTFLVRATEIHPHYYPARLDLGLIDAAEGRWEASEKHLRTALQEVPEDVEIREVLQAVIAGRAREESEKQRMRDLWPQLRRRRKDLLPAEVQLLRRVRRELREFGASHLEILLTENLWADFAAAAVRRPLIDVAWAASIAYASHRLQGRTIRRAEVAETWGVSAARLGRRFRRIMTTLDLEALDRRYSVDDEESPAILQIDQQCESAPCREADSSGSLVIPVDFMQRQRLPDSTSCPCGSGQPVSTCSHDQGSPD